MVPYSPATPCTVCVGTLCVSVRELSPLISCCSDNETIRLTDTMTYIIPASVYHERHYNLPQVSIHYREGTGASGKKTGKGTGRTVRAGAASHREPGKMRKNSADGKKNQTDTIQRSINNVFV